MNVRNYVADASHEIATTRINTHRANSSQEQMADVLDAMFEKTVQPGEFIIRQGDDGDNFYVIER